MAFKPPQEVLDMATGEREVMGATAFLRGEAPEIFTTDNLSADPQFKNTIAPYKQLDWQDKLGAAFNQNSPLINWNDARDLEYARNSKQELDVPDELLKEGIPPEFLPVVLNEKYENGGVAAITLRDQIKDDVANKRIMDNLEWYAQLGYSAGGFLLDPTTYIGGAGSVKAIQMTGTGLKSLNILSKSLPNTTQKLLQWGSVGAVESAVLNAPKLSGDHTYTYENYQTDILADMLLGAGLTYAGSKLINKASTFQLQRSNRESAVVEQVKMMDAELNTKGKAEADFDAQGYHAAYKARGVGARTVPTSQKVRDYENRVPTQRELFESSSIHNQAGRDNESAWLNVDLQNLQEQVKALGPFRNRVDLNSLRMHPAHTSPTIENLMDFNSQLDIKLAEAHSVLKAELGVTRPAESISLKQARYDKNLSGFERKLAIVLDDLLPTLRANDVDGARSIQNLQDTFDVLHRAKGRSVKKVRDWVTSHENLRRRKDTESAEWSQLWQGLRQLTQEVTQDVTAPSQGKSAEMMDVLRRIDSLRSSVKPVEIDAVSKKVASRASREASRDSIAKSDSSNLSYSARWEGRGVTEHPHTEAEVELAKVSVRMQLDNDEIPVSVIAENIEQMKAIQAEAKAVAPESDIAKVNLSSGKLESSTDSAAEVVQDPQVREALSTRLLRQSFEKLNNEVSTYHASGEHKVYKDLLSPSNIGQTAARAVTQWGGITRDLATTFIESGSPTLNYIGTHLTEMGRGYGGDVMRKHTAGVIRESEYIKSVSMIMPDYDKAVKAYAASKGSNAVGQMMAATSVGGRNKLQADFAKEFMVYMNNTRRGRDVDNPLMADFAKKWNAYMRHNYKQLESNNIAGFTGDNQRNNYVPQVWNIRHAQRMVRNEPGKVRALLTRATGDSEKAEHLIEWFTKQDSATYDGYVATNDSRALERMEVDWDVEVDGLSVLDLLETDTRKLATAYSNRVAGWVGVSKATNGKLTSYTDLNALKTMVWQETGKGKDVEVVNDVIDLLFGRPVKGGLPDYGRSIKAATVLTRLGSLGSAQLIESGTVATRAIMETMGDPKFMAKLTKGMSPKETAQDLLEIQKLTGNNWDFHLINTEAEYWTEFDLANTSKLQNQVDWAVDKATFGSAKQVAGRAFGHVTGYNQVRRFQAQMVQRSFAMQTARYFKHGESKLSTQRMADFGLTDANGRNDILKEAIERHVEFDADGYPSKYNFDRWSQDAKDTFMYSMQRAEATELMRPLIGEMPEWFNRPWVQMVMQFRSMPLVAQNKALGRSLAFADKEAVYQLVLNAMTSGLVRYSKFAGLAALATAGGGSFVDEYNKQLDNAGRDAILGGAVDRYITQGGMYSDVYALSTIGASASTPQQYVEKTMGQIPALGLIKDYAMTAYRASEGDGDKALNHAMRVIPLSNTLALEATATLVEESVEALE